MDTDSRQRRIQCYQVEMGELDAPREVLGVALLLLCVGLFVILAGAALVWVGIRLFV